MTGQSPRANWCQKQRLQVLSLCPTHFAFQLLFFSFFCPCWLALLTKFFSRLTWSLFAGHWLTWFQSFLKRNYPFNNINTIQGSLYNYTLLACTGCESSAQTSFLSMTCLYFCRCKGIHRLQGTAVIVGN